MCTHTRKNQEPLEIDAGYVVIPLKNNTTYKMNKTEMGISFHNDRF